MRELSLNKTELKKYCAWLYDIPHSLMDDEPEADLRWQIAWLLATQRNFVNVTTAVHFITGLRCDIPAELQEVYRIEAKVRASEAMKAPDYIEFQRQVEDLLRTHSEESREETAPCPATPSPLQAPTCNTSC